MVNKIVQGTLRTNPRGFGFVIVKDINIQDIFIPATEMNDAIDEDIVEAEITNITSKGPEGTITRIIKREKKHFVGTIYSDKKKELMAHVPFLGPNWPVYVKTKKPLKFGDRILLEVLDWKDKKNRTICKMIKYLAHISDAAKDTFVAINEFNIRDEFSKDIKKEVQNLKITKEELKKRKDLSDLLSITIDPVDAKDFDDAVSISKDKNNNFNLAVHITDVAYFVKADTLLDKEAAMRANSTYFPDICIPMLPKELSNGLCSLQENQIRLTVSVLMQFSSKGDLLNYSIERSFIKSRKRLSYEKAKKILDSRNHKYKKTLDTMVELCLLLKKKRFERGSIDFALSDVRIILDKKGMPIKIQTVEYDITHQLIEEFMLKANEVVATHLSKLSKSAIYRIHEEPLQENFKEFYDLAKSLGFELPAKPQLEDMQKLFSQAKNTKYLQILSISFIKNLKLACYSIENLGHFGLALKYYTHFTSPIRRYSDLIIQRLLFNEEKQDIDFKGIALVCSEKERISFKAETSVATLKKLRFLKKIIRKEPNKIFTAIITKVKRFGIYFDLENYFVNGFLHISELKDDYYEYFPETLKLVGFHSHKIFSFAKKIRVKITHIDLILQEVEYQYIRKNKP